MCSHLRQGRNLDVLNLQLKKQTATEYPAAAKLYGINKMWGPVLNAYRKYEITLMFTVWYFLILHKALYLVALETEFNICGSVHHAL